MIHVWGAVHLKTTNISKHLIIQSEGRILLIKEYFKTSIKWTLHVWREIFEAIIFFFSEFPNAIQYLRKTI